MNRTALRSFAFFLCMTVAASASAQTSGSAKNAQGSAQAPAQAPAVTRNVEAPSYIIQPNDVLRIFVWKDETLSQARTLVRPDGRISLPLVQDIPAAGQTPSQMKVKLEEKLKEWIDVPNVTVIVDTIQSYEIYMMGNVASPGVVKSATPLTILQALGTAGGFKDFAEKNNVTIIRGKDRLKFNFEEFMKGKVPNENVTLISGDVVWVP